MCGPFKCFGEYAYTMKLWQPSEVWSWDFRTTFETGLLIFWYKPFILSDIMHPPPLPRMEWNKLLGLRIVILKVPETKGLNPNTSLWKNQGHIYSWETISTTTTALLFELPGWARETLSLILSPDVCNMQYSIYIPIFTVKFRLSTSSPMAATSVQTRIEGILIYSKYYIKSNFVSILYPSLNNWVTLSFSEWELSPFNFKTNTSAPNLFSSFPSQAAEIKCLKLNIFLQLF